ncbi:MAG: glycyl-radical enzyme activating protein [Anaerolineae bacterium]
MGLSDNTAEPLGLITNIQRFSIHDGPGIRTTVFYKGCPLRCFWCHNPETLRPRPELQVFPDRCIGCDACVAACPEAAHVAVAGERRFKRELCRACGRCAETCYAEALVLVGRRWGVAEALAVLERDRPFYERSGGGVTLSGGEPLAQRQFTLALLQACKRAGLHTAVETSAFAPWREIEALLPWLDLAMVDVKLADGERHRAATGVPNEVILDNVRRLGQALPLIVRTPVVPGVNDDEQDVAAIAALVRELPNLLYYELMPFHRLAESKYRSLGTACATAGMESPTAELLRRLCEAARNAGIADVRVSG